MRHFTAGPDTSVRIKRSMKLMRAGVVLLLEAHVWNEICNY